MKSPLAELAHEIGFLPSYVNCFGKTVTNSDQALSALIKSLGYVIDTVADIEAQTEHLRLQKWLDIMPVCHVVDSQELQHSIQLCLPIKSGQLNWCCHLEEGRQVEGQVLLDNLMPQASKTIDHTTYYCYTLNIEQLPLGYHRVSIAVASHHAETHLIVTPSHCYTPDDANLSKVWGFAAQLYSLSSDSSWGIGDFGCLRDLVQTAADKHISAIGLNPLHPLYPSNPAHRSPYSPTSRYYLNAIYIDIQNVPGYQESGIEKGLLATDDFKTKLEAVRQSEFIDYEAAGKLKFQALSEIFQTLESVYLDPETDWGKSLQDFRDDQGDDLESLATYDALYEHFIAEGRYGWFSWPEVYQDPNSKAVQQFKRNNRARIHYYAWLQWLAHEQLSSVSDHAKSAGMAVGLYLDLAVGCDGGGAEVWANQDAFLAGASVGAPPDAMNVLGQDWGLTPMNPNVLQAQGYEPLAKALRCSMQYSGALRIDHILGFMRQYWVAPGNLADQGIFIRFPMQDMMRIIALESQRSQCMVIGEDLGTVPEGFTEAIMQSGLLSYKVLFFERWESGLYKRPELYPRQSMATISTHDLHTFMGWWTGRDLEWRRKLNLYPNQAMSEADQEGRPTDRDALCAALLDYDLINEQTLALPEDQKSHQLLLAAQRFLAYTDSVIQLIPMEDALELTEQVNIPGTIDDHPNWKRKLPLSVNAFWQRPEVQELVKVMQSIRPNEEGE